MNLLLLLLSIIIYASFGISSLVYILLNLLISFILAKYLKKENKYSKIILASAIILNSVVLLLIRISPYTNWTILAPLGISYFTLQIISYLVDVYKGKYKYEKNLLYYALYIIYIPHLFIGPITRYEEMKEQIIAKKTITLNNLYNGGIRILWGLFKKLIIAGRISIIIETIISNTQIYNGAYALFAMLLYSIQLYSDFSGGIDIVLGISNIMGIKLSENFDSPYLSQTIKEFWRRWHISLSSWLKDYIYIPLGGSRCSKIRKMINLIITFFVSGLWHGANYIIWGIIHGILVFMGDIYKTKSKIINRIITFIIVSILWSFFIWQNNITAIQMIISVFTKFNIIEVAKNILNLGLTGADWIVLIISTIILFIYDANKDRIKGKITKMNQHKKLILICLSILIILTFGIYGIGFNVNEFIYSKF